MSDAPVSDAVDAIHAKDRRQRRGFVALGILVIVALSIGGVVQYINIRAVSGQVNALKQTNEHLGLLIGDLREEGETRDALLKLIRKRDRRSDHRNVKGHNAILRALDRILEEVGIELVPPLEVIRQRPRGGGADGSGDTGGSTPPPTVGQSNQCPPKNPHCQEGGKP